MLQSLRTALLALRDRDLMVRSELAASGALYDGYHPRMEAVHRENARALRELIARFGWPHAGMAGQDGAEAAWLVAQHAIGEPEFMRHCRELLAAEVSAGRVPPRQFAYLDDRIRVSEGKPQRFGTQFDMTPAGPVLCDVETPELLDDRRRAVGLDPVARHVATLPEEPRPTLAAYRERKAAEHVWRRNVGWLRDDQS